MKNKHRLTSQLGIVFRSCDTETGSFCDRKEDEQVLETELSYQKDEKS